MSDTPDGGSRYGNPGRGAQCIVDLDRMVTMRDGVRLAADIYRPDDSDRHPVLVARSPYPKFGPGLVNPLTAVQAGYVVVVQETRGRFHSEGEFTPFHNERNDGYDTIEWAAAQPWSTGAVAVIGQSAVGATAVQTALAAPPHLRCMAVVHTGFSPHSGWVYANGALELGFLHGWVRRFAASAKDAPGRSRELVTELHDWYEHPERVLRKLPLDGAFSRELVPFFFEWLEHPSYDSYWAEVDAVSNVQRIAVPVLHITGWYDGLLLGHMNFQRALQEHEDRTVREESRLVVGPWDHQSYMLPTMSSWSGERDFGGSALSGPGVYDPILFRWFDRWLVGKAESLVESPVRYFVMGERRWAETRTWPPGGESCEWYLSSSGRANTRFGDGVLVERPSPEAPVDTYRYDPASPTPTVGGRHMAFEFATGGVRDQTSVEERDDVLVYVGPLLTKAISVAGRIVVRLFASSSAPDTDFCAKLVDVEPSGYRAIIAEGIVRARYRQGLDHEVTMEPGEIVDFEIDCWDTAHTFRSGHRIGLEIASANFPRHDRSLNTVMAAAQADLSDGVVAIQSVYHDTERPSRLILPVVPAEEAS